MGLNKKIEYVIDHIYTFNDTQILATTKLLLLLEGTLQYTEDAKFVKALKNRIEDMYLSQLTSHLVSVSPFSD